MKTEDGSVTRIFLEINKGSKNIYLTTAIWNKGSELYKVENFENDVDSAIEKAQKNIDEVYDFQKEELGQKLSNAYPSSWELSPGERFEENYVLKRRDRVRQNLAEFLKKDKEAAEEKEQEAEMLKEFLNK